MVIEVKERPSPDSPFWEKAYRNHYKSLCHLVGYKLTNGNMDDAEETVSEAFRRVIEYTTKPETITNIPGYLWSIARNVWLTRVEREKTAPTVSLDDSDKVTLENQLPRTEIEPEVLSILSNERLFNEIKANRGPLTPRENLLLTRHLEGYSCDEIAIELGEDVRLISVDLNAVRNKVRYRLKKARERQNLGS